MHDQSIVRMQSDAADTDLSIIKIISFIAAISSVALSGGYFVATLQLGYAFAALIIFLVLFTLQTLFVKSWIRIIPAIAIESLMMITPTLIIFRQNLSIYMLVAGLILFFLLTWAETDGRNELRNFIKIHFWRVSKTVLLKSITAVVLFVVLIYISISGVASGSSLSQDGAISSAVNAFIAPTLKLFVKDYSPTVSMRDLIAGILAKQGIPEDALQLGVNQFKNNLNNMLGINLDLNSPVGESVYKTISDKLDGITGPSKIYLIASMILILWFTIRGISFILFLPISLITFIVYEILIVSNFAVIQYESRSREIILLR